MTTRHLIYLLLSLLIIGYTLFFTTQLTLHYHSYGSRAFDLGNMGQAIWNSAQGNWFHQTNQPGATNRLSLHVEPILIPISWIYYFYPQPEILFLLQSIIVALGVIPMYALAHLKLNSKGLALIFGLIYLMYPPLQAATLLDFHAVTLTPTFLLTAFYFLETKRPHLFALFSILAISCKEDITLLVLMFGLYALVINRQYKIGLFTIGACFAWAFVAVFIIPPMFAQTDNIHWNRYYHLGSSPLDIVFNMILQPTIFINHLYSIKAWDYFKLLLQPTAYVALLSPATLLLALPSYGINLLSNFPPMQRVNSLIYAAPVIHAVMISSIYGVVYLKRFGSYIKPTLVGKLLTDKTLFGFTSTHYSNLIISLILMIATLSYQIQYGYLPGGGQYRGWETVTAHHKRGEAIFAQIPPTAKLSAMDRLNPHVSQRETLYLFDRVDDADYILLDITLDSWPLHPIQLRDQIYDFLRGEFGIVDAVDGYLLLAKDQPHLPTELPNSFYHFVRAPTDMQPQYPVKVMFADKLELLGYDIELGAHEEFLPVITMYWRAQQPLEHDYNLWPFVIDRTGNLIETPTERPLVATLWYPTSRWSTDEIIVTRTLPYDLGDQFTIAVGVAQGDWNDNQQRLAIADTIPTLPQFEGQRWVRLNTFQKIGRKSYQPIKSEEPLPQQRMQVQFWDLITLDGVTLPQTALKPASKLPFTLYWHTIAPLTIDLTTFVHLVDKNNNVVAQLDWTSQDSLGYLPTTAWIPNQPVIDQQTISLINIPPGTYQLLIGWYYPLTGDRLPVTQGGQGDIISLGTIEVEE